MHASDKAEVEEAKLASQLVYELINPREVMLDVKNFMRVIFYYLEMVKMSKLNIYKYTKNYI